MPEYLAPGVYMEEVSAGAKPIEGVSTSTAGFLGETERGPVEPEFVSSFTQFQRIYGQLSWKTKGKPSHLPYALEGFFANGGKRCFVARIVGDGSTTASLTLGVQTEASAQGATARSTTEESGEPEQPVSGEGSAADTSGETKRSKKKGRRETESSSGNPGAGSNGDFTIQAVGPGEWGNRIRITIEEASEVSNNKPDLFKLIVQYDSAGPSGETTIEEYDNLDTNPVSSGFYENKINNASNLIKVVINQEPARPEDCKDRCLENGSDDGQAPMVADYKGSEGPDGRTGLKAFEAIDEISIVCAPNENDVQMLSDALISHCENLKDRFAVLQIADGMFDVSKVNRPADSKYAAFYYPWVKVMDPVTRGLKLVPPGGHMVGIYARSDITRGVHKAPANEVVRGIAGLERQVTKEQQDILNPKGINCIRLFQGRGVRVWGARTASSDPEWKYVNVRRLFLYLEESIEEGTQWVVFEPNNQQLWDRVKQSVTTFLTRVWRDGALMGNTAGEAFYVKCDETTMTQDDIDNGRLIVEIGVAPVKPAEFVIFRISQWRGGSALSE